MSSSYVGVSVPYEIDSLAFNPFEINTDNIGIYDEFFNPDINLLNSDNMIQSCQYFSEDQFNDMSHALSHDDFSVIYTFSTMHLNVRSLPKNYDHLQLHVSTLTHSFSIIAFSETWLNDDITDLYPISQYNAIHSCRKNRVGGGVSLYVFKNFNFTPRKELSVPLESTLVESVFIEISSCHPFNGKTIIIGCIYRPPDTDPSTFNEALYSTLEIIIKEHKMCVLLGDFNIDLLKSELPSTVDFLNTLYSTYFSPTNS